MDVLKVFYKLPILFALACSGCLNSDGTITRVVELETDTYISSNSDTDNSLSTSLVVSKSGDVENRILLKLPTGDQNADLNLDLCIGNPFCFVYFIPMLILRAILNGNCADETFTAPNLNWAYLSFDTVDGMSPAVGSLQLNLLGQPWWHDANWFRAHPFTSNGAWTSPGGSLDTSTAFEPNCTNLQGGETCGAGEVKFEMTEYFRTLLNNVNSEAHFGLVMRRVADGPEVRLHSVQSSSFNRTPRVVANYNCISNTEPETQIFYLGTPLN